VNALSMDTSGTSSMISAVALTKVYKTHGAEIVALEAVDLSIKRGEDVAVIGASGSGKSTFMNLVGGLDRPTSGKITVDGHVLHDLDSDRLAAFRNLSVGFVFQQFNLLPSLSAIDNVAMPLLYRGLARSERRDRAAVILERLGLADRMLHKPTQLSGGQQQRVAIGRALVGEPRLLLADEPTGALDSRTSSEILAVLRNLCDDGLTLLMVTHDPDVAKGAARRIVFHDGHVSGDDSASMPT
jgi:putative ABC transport system ATP-binding protein